MGAGFHAAHFGDEGKRAWFAARLRGAPLAPAADSGDKGADAKGTPRTREEWEDAWTTLAPAEDDAAWQARHGVQYLTPGAARLFDASRRFRETRAHDGEAPPQHGDAGLRSGAQHSALPAPAHGGLADLRSRALAAMHRGRGTDAHSGPAGV
ncbi:hypothetical protein MSPP1_001758 [Malassezia sp. CBS 17886]|nr:hypothetical protein MSPP1_001758 [Malassezia sp. CBS 17886]